MTQLSINNYNARAALKKDGEFLDLVSVALARKWQTMILSTDPESVILAKSIRDDRGNTEVFRWGKNIASDDAYVQKIVYIKEEDEAGNLLSYQFSEINNDSELDSAVTRLWDIMKLL